MNHQIMFVRNSHSGINMRRKSFARPKLEFILHSAMIPAKDFKSYANLDENFSILTNETNLKHLKLILATS